MKRHRVKRASKEEKIPQDSDGQFAFIAGYTEGGFPYGTTWDEMLEDAHREDVPEPDSKGSMPLNHSFHYGILL